MTYQVLATRWRPGKFDELVGQEHVLRALTNALDNDRVHHAFLFTGTRGVGKTTIARILAKSLNCEQGVSSKPCGECSACTAIEQGRFVDLIEVDAASRTKVEDTRELLDNVQYAPTQGRYKVYLIDEVHMLSTHSFNALLKTLEEPPPHVKFLLATTDPQKLPVTILSRCLQYNLKRLTMDQIQQQLVHILDQEQVKYAAGACSAIARAADGSMRDALSLLDQAIAYCDYDLRVKEVHEMLGSIEQNYLYKILVALSNQDASLIMQLVTQIAERAPDFKQLLAELISLLHRVALVQQVPDALDDWWEDREQLLELAKILKVEDVQLYYQIAVTGRRDLSWVPDQKSGVEMLLLRMLAFRPVDAATSAQSSSSSISTQQVDTEKHVAVTSPAAKTKSPTGQKAVSSPSPAKKPAGNSGANEWNEMIRKMQIAGPVRQLANYCAFEGMQNDTVQLVLDPKYESICSKDMQQRLEEALQNSFGSNLKLNMSFRGSEIESPVATTNRQANEKHQEAVNSIKQDSTVQEIQNMFDAQVSPDLIRSSD